MNDSKKVLTGKVRFSYVTVFEPKSLNGDVLKYSVSLLIPKKDIKTLEKIRKAIEIATNDGIEKFGGKIPSNLKTPLRDGDDERPNDLNYKDHYFINASSVLKPEVLDKYKRPIVDPSEFYSGCYGYATINFYAFNVSGNKGIACGLCNLMKSEDGERLDGRSNAQTDFASINFVDDEVQLLFE